MILLSLLHNRMGDVILMVEIRIGEIHMKKIIALLLTFALAITLLGCGKKPTASSEPSAAPTQETTSPATKPTQTAQTEPPATKPAQPAQTEPPATEPTETAQTEPPTQAFDIQDTDAYRRIASLKYADRVPTDVLEAFARYVIRDPSEVMEQYDDEWVLILWENGEYGMWCFGPLLPVPGEEYDDYKKHVWCVKADRELGKAVGYWEGMSIYKPLIREDIEASVYGAEDPVGVTDEVKEAFVDFILDSDWFMVYLSGKHPYLRDCTWRWSFAEEPLPGEADQRTYIQLQIRAILPEDSNYEDSIAVLYYDGETVRQYFGE